VRKGGRGGGGEGEGEERCAWGASCRERGGQVRKGRGGVSLAGEGAGGEAAGGGEGGGAGGGVALG